MKKLLILLVLLSNVLTAKNYKGNSFRYNDGVFYINGKVVELKDGRHRFYLKRINDVDSYIKFGIKNGKLDGEFTVYTYNNEVYYYTGQYDQGIKVGEWLHYYKKLMGVKEIYSQGSFINGKKEGEWKENKGALSASPDFHFSSSYSFTSFLPARDNYDQSVNIGTYKNDKRVGTWSSDSSSYVEIDYDNNALPLEKRIYSDRMLVKEKILYENGEEKKNIKYLLSNKISRIVYKDYPNYIERFYPNDLVWSKGIKQSNGFFYGKKFYPDNTPMYDGTSLNSTTQYYDTGQLHWIYTYDTKELKEFSRDGVLVRHNVAGKTLVDYDTDIIEIKEY